MSDKVLAENEWKEVENFYLKKVLKVFAILSSGGVYNDKRWEPRKDPDNPRPLLIHSANLLHSFRNAKVIWDGQDNFITTVEERHYPGKEVTTRDVFLYHQLGTSKMPARPIINELEKNDIEDIRRLIDQKTKKQQERFYQRWYENFIQAVRMFWRQ